MSNRNFDASVIAKRLRDQNVAQQLYGSFTNGKAAGNPQTVSTQVSIITTEYYPGVQTTVEQSLQGSTSFDLGGIANYVPDPNAGPSGPVVTVPDAPVITSAIEGNLSATVSFTIGSDGGLPITLYEYSTDNGITWTAFSPVIPTSPVTISGLSLGFNYLIGIRAINAIGNSLASNFVSIDGKTTPGAPTITSITRGDQLATVNFTAGSNGNSTITNYQYAYSTGGAYTSYTNVGGTSSPITITGLTNGTTYSIKIRAINAIGSSADSNIVTVVPSATPASLPNAPTLNLGVPGDGLGYIYFTAGDSNGSTIINYKYNINGGSYNLLSPADTSSPVLIPSIANGFTYTITLIAVNGVGDSVASNSISITPVASSVPSSYLYYDPSVLASYSGSGPTINNIGSYGTLDGTMINVTYDSTIAGGIFDFNGTSSHIAFDNFNFGNFNFGNSFTVTAWVFPRVTGTINGLLANIGANQSPAGFKLGWNWWRENSKAIYFEGGNGASGGSNNTIRDVINYNTWQHLAYVFDKTNSQIIFFLNGLPVDMGSSISTVANVNTSSAAFRIGSFTDGSYRMNARLGYLKMFNSELSAGDIYADYNTTRSRFGL